MAADATTPYKLERTITLSQLKPNEYRLWVVRTEATFQAYKCLNIVLGKEANPIPIDDDVTPIGPIGEQHRTTIMSWETRLTPSLKEEGIKIHRDIKAKQPWIAITVLFVAIVTLFGLVVPMADGVMLINTLSGGIALLVVLSFIISESVQSII